MRRCGSGGVRAGPWLGDRAASVGGLGGGAARRAVPAETELSDQVIREDPAVRSSYVRGRGTETSAEVLVGPPWRMESNAGQQQWY